MKHTITISITEEISEELDKVARREGVSRNDLIRESLRDFLFVRNFRRLRERLITKAQAQGVHTDQDVFDRVS